MFLSNTINLITNYLICFMTTKLLFNCVSTSDIKMCSVCNVANKRKIVEDFIQVNPKCISNC